MQKAQGALEYLLLIGGAILVSAISIGLIISLTSTSEEETILVTASALCAKFPPNECRFHTVTIKEQSFECFSVGVNKCRVFDGVLLMHLDDGVSGPVQPILDSSRKGNNGVTVGITDCDVPGKFGKACSFTPAIAYIDIPFSSSLDFTNSDFTISAWIKPDNADFWQAIVTTGDAYFSFGEGWRLAYDGEVGDMLEFSIKNGSEFGVFFEFPAGDLSDGVWHHVAVTVDRDDDAIIYLDGIALISNNVSSEQGGSLGNFNVRISANGEAAGGPLRGSIDEVAIWNRVLSQTEIEFLASQ